MNMNPELSVTEREQVNSEAKKSLTGLHIALFSLHGLIRAEEMELGRDADTGGQTKYVLELASELAKQPGVKRVDLITRQIVDPKVDACYAQLEESISPNASIIRIPFGPKR